MFHFKKKTKPASYRITLFREDQSVLLQCPLTDFALPEDVVLGLSVTYFNDPEPCSIHRGAVLKRALMEVMEQCPTGSTVLLSHLPESMRRYFPQGTASIRITEE